MAHPPLAPAASSAPAVPLALSAFARRLGPALLAAALGLVLLYGVGLAQAHLAHNAAHDTRHATGFPCH
jgi:cobalt transporter subunit CbtB